MATLHTCEKGYLTYNGKRVGATTSQYFVYEPPVTPDWMPLTEFREFSVSFTFNLDDGFDKWFEEEMAWLIFERWLNRQLRWLWW